jgi:hypothetical protein
MTENFCGLSSAYQWSRLTIFDTWKGPNRRTPAQVFLFFFFVLPRTLGGRCHHPKLKHAHSVSSTSRTHDIGDDTQTQTSQKRRILCNRLLERVINWRNQCSCCILQSCRNLLHHRIAKFVARCLLRLQVQEDRKAK